MVVGEVGGGGGLKVRNKIKIQPFNGKKTKDTLYRLTDEYSLFYLKFIEKRKRNVSNTWQALSQTATFKSWSGYAFESVCLKHITAIKEALKIGGIYAEPSSFLFQGNDAMPGAQIDLLIDRNDQVINLCEIKFYKTTFTISKSYAGQLRNKIAVFTEASKTKKQIFLTMITTFGVADNKYSQDFVDNNLTMDMLFEG